MDLRTSTARATAVEREAVDRVCAVSSPIDGSMGPGSGGMTLSRAGRPRLLEALWALQEAAGEISRGGLDYTCTRLGVAPADAYGVASAYAMFNLDSGAELRAHLCDDIACRAACGGDPAEDLDRFAPDQPGASWHRSPCLGHCEFGSAVLFQRSGSEPLRWTQAPVRNDNIDTHARPSDRVPLVPQAQDHPDALHLLRRVGQPRATSVDAYRGLGGFQALSRAMEMGPDWVIQEVKAARLLGRGGAAFPTATKWAAVRANPTRPHYVVCNADESEPGTFKDRVILENDPFSVIESLTISGWATGSERGYVYIRGEYPLAEQRLTEARDRCAEAGYLGSNILGSGFSFEIEIRRGAGAYIAGEETALFNSIEGKRPEPRNKPPFPTDFGLFGKPTAANNVETLINVPEILINGAGKYAELGTPESTGTRLFCVSGAVSNPGLYELPMGTSLRRLMTESGAFDQGTPKAVLLGGAAGVFIGPDQFDLALSFEAARAEGVTLGSGVVVVFNALTDFHEVIRRIARFFRDESCGQCVPCRIGTVRQEEFVERLLVGQPVRSWRSEFETYAELATAMKDASICGLGQTATSAIESALRLKLIGSELSPAHGMDA